MTNLDKVFNTWKSIEKVYSDTGKKKKQSRKQFAVMMIGSPDSLVKLRELVNKDFDEEPESVTKLNRLFSVLERAQKRLEEVDEIDDLETFVWSDNWGNEEEDEEYTVYSFNPSTRKDYSSAKELVKKGFYDTAVTMASDGKISCLVADPNSKDLLVFRDVYSVLVWMGQMESELEEKENEFVRQVYAILAKQVAERALTLPLAFNATKNYPKWCSEFLREDEFTVTTLSGNEYKCNLNAWSYRADTLDGQLQVIVFV